MDAKTKDFLERLAFAVAFVAIGIAIPYLTGINEGWAVAIVAGLQIVKNLLAQQVGDPHSAGFTDLVKDEANADFALPEGDPDGVEADPALADEAAEAGDGQ